MAAMNHHGAEMSMPGLGEIDGFTAFSSESLPRIRCGVDTGSHEENASKQKVGPAAFRLIGTAEALMPLAKRAALKRDNSPPRRRRCRDLGQFEPGLRQLLGDA